MCKKNNEGGRNRRTEGGNIKEKEEENGNTNEEESETNKFKEKEKDVNGKFWKKERKARKENVEREKRER